MLKTNMTKGCKTKYKTLFWADNKARTALTTALDKNDDRET